MPPTNTRTQGPPELAGHEIPDRGIQVLLDELMSIDIKDFKSVQARMCVMGELAKQFHFPSLEP